MDERKTKMLTDYVNLKRSLGDLKRKQEQLHKVSDWFWSDDADRFLPAFVWYHSCALGIYIPSERAFWREVRDCVDADIFPRLTKWYKQLGWLRARLAVRRYYRHADNAEYQSPEWSAFLRTVVFAG